MAQPQPYNRQFNFADQQALTPSAPLPGQQVDAELNAVKLTFDQTLANLAKIQRDDGALKNGIVTQDSLSESLTIGFTLRGPWEVGVNYILSDGVTYNSKFYRALIAHLSTNLNRPDLDGTVWEEVADFASISADAAASAAAALASENAAAASATAASGSASAASASAIDADGFADAADASAAAAAASATEAAQLIGGTVTEAVRHDVAQGLSAGQQLQARQNIGITANGSSIVTGATAAGVTVATAADAAAQRTALGANANGSDIFANASALGATLAKIADAAAGRTAIDAAPLPKTATGAGQVVLIDTSGSIGGGYSLPSGGTWFYFAFRVSNTGSVPGGNTFVGVAAGGTSIIAGLGSHFIQGFALRLT